MKRLLLISACAVTLTGCVTTPLDLDKAQSVEPTSYQECPANVPISKITVARGHSYSGHGVDIRVSLDGTEVVRLRPGQKSTMCVDGSKSHFVTTDALFHSPTTVPIIAQENVEFILQSGTDMGGTAFCVIQSMKPLNQ